MLVTYLKITAVSLPLIWLLSLSPSINEWRKAISRQPAIWVTGLILFALFFWPSDASSAHDLAGLSGGRLARVIILPLVGLYWLYQISLVSKVLSRTAPWTLALVLYCVWALISVSYSPDPLLSLWKCFEYFVLIVFAIGIQAYTRTLGDYMDLFNGAMFLVLAVCVFSAVGIVLEPSLSLSINPDLDGAAFSGDMHSRWGIFPRVNPNSLAQFGALLSSVAVVEFYRSSRSHGMLLSLVVLIGLFCVLAAHSRTSLFALGFMLVLIAFFLRRGGLLFVYVAIAALLGIAAMDLILEFVLRGQSAEQFSSLTGRTLIWELAWEKFLKSPIWGFGFYAGHLSLDVSHIFSDRFSTVDNTFLEVMVDLGIIGLFLIVLALARILRNAFRAKGGLLATDDVSILWVQAVVVTFAILVRATTAPTFHIFHVNAYLLIVVASVFGALAWVREHAAGK